MVFLIILMDHHESWVKNKLEPIIFILLFVNVLGLDIFTLYNLLFKKEKYLNQTGAASISITPSPITSTEAKPESEDCSPNCKSAIDQALAPFKITPSATPRSTKTQSVAFPTSAPVIQPTSAGQQQTTVKEFFIPLGTGSSTAADWTDVPGVKAEVDSSKYPNIQKVLFEASTHVPNANEIVEVRLYNESDKYVVGNSEFLYPSGTIFPAMPLPASTAIFRLSSFLTSMNFLTCFA